ncbi:MAG: hypothetical protein GX410_09795 [Elusimicrobia bacterium]|nr:hypothetical protein [Elusimicrobiota bacterium]
MKFFTAFFRVLHRFFKRHQSSQPAGAPVVVFWLYLAALALLMCVYLVLASMGMSQKARVSTRADQIIADVEKVRREVERQAAEEKVRLAKLKEEQEKAAVPVEKKLEVRGDQAFRDKAIAGLQVIYIKDTKAYRIFRKVISAIAPGSEGSKYEVVEGTPTLLLAPEDANRSTAWCAGTIARVFALTYQQYLYSMRSRVAIAAPPPPGQESNTPTASVTIKPFDYNDAYAKAVGYQIKIMKLAGASVQEINEFMSKYSKPRSSTPVDVPFSSNATVDIEFSSGGPVF